jgi:hypothetical protein
VTVKHAFTSAIADGADATLVRPTNWNADHTVTLIQESRALAADETIAAAKSSLVVGDLEIGTDVVLELAADAVLEIS